MSEAGEGGNEHARRRLRGFGVHLVAYFAAMVVLVGASVFFSPENPWVLAPVVAWGAVLAVHAAYAMGFFDVFRGKAGHREFDRRTQFERDGKV